jgi:hypothetical protein
MLWSQSDNQLDLQEQNGDDRKIQTQVEIWVVTR